MTSVTMESVLRWRGEGQEVCVAGQWNDWQPQVLAREGEGGNWLIRLPLVPGKYQYKWVVDGVWTINEDLPVVTDDGGNVNNQLEVEEEMRILGIKHQVYC